MYVDLYPTLLELARAKSKPPQVLDGESLVPLLKEPAAILKRAAIHFHFPGYLEGYSTKNWRTTPVGFIQAGDWKLMEFFDTGALELYNLADDIGEHRNLAAAMPERTQELHAQLVAWRKRVGAALPSKK